MGSAVALNLKAGLEAKRLTKDEALTWYAKHEKSLDEEDREACRGVLGLEIPLYDRPFTSIIPQSGWFANLMDLTHDMESPYHFTFLAGTVVLGQLLGKRIIIRRGGSDMWPGCNVLLVSPAGEGRRSTICDFIVYRIGVPAGLPLIADSFSYEGMGDTLVALPEPSALLYAGELSVLLGKGSYGESIIPKVTDIVGKTTSFNWTTVKRGKVTFVQPCIHGLFTSAPDWLAENIPAVAFGGGLWSRFLMGVASKRAKAVTWSEPIPDNRIASFVSDTKALIQRTGGIVGKPEGAAWKWYDEWYQEHARNGGDLPDERMAPYYSRKHDHLLRLSLLLQASQRVHPLRFTDESFQQALDILTWLEYGMPKVYGSMALTPYASAQKAIVAALQRAGGSLDHSRLHKRVYRILPLASHFKETMESLIEMGVVTASSSFNGKGRNYILLKTLD